MLLTWFVKYRKISQKYLKILQITFNVGNELIFV